MIFHRIKSYFKYKLKAGNEHDVHSPFIFNLYITAIKPSKHYYFFDQIQAYLLSLQTSNKLIPQEDYGTGKNKQAASVKSIFKKSGHQKHHYELLFKLSDYFKPKTILELGTNLGVSTLYLHAAVFQQCKTYTFEGNKALCSLCDITFQQFRFNNIKIIEGNINDTLPTFLVSQQPQIDLAYLDANHTYEATMAYFNQIRPYLHENSVVVVDDIYWSQGMTKAWEQLKTHANQSIDLYQFGILFFRKNQASEHFILK